MYSAEQIEKYYREPRVRQRILEFLGADRTRSPTCEYITADDEHGARRVPRPREELEEALGKGRDICRSLWDTKSLIAHLDVEYVNFDRPQEPYENPKRTFALQEPVVCAIKRLLRRCGIRALHVLSGRGHHFVWRIEQTSRAFQELVEIGHESPSLHRVDSRRHPPYGHIVESRLARAFSGLGLVIEYLAQRVKRLAAADCEIPVEFTAVEVGPYRRGREMVSLDISEYGDPLHTRAIRLPFSVYLKPWHLFDGAVVESWMPIVFVPVHGMTLSRALQVMHAPKEVATLASRVPAEIPEQSEGMSRLLGKYKRSSLAAFHSAFFSEEHDPPERWPETYDRTPLDPLPPCVRNVLLYPNDLLLRPWGMRAVTRVLLALGWHPRHIAGLIRSKFERDFGWGDQWTEYDPATRADFYVRIFSGLFATGEDDLVDFNCQSCKEEQLCPVEECAENLDTFRNLALERRNHGDLAYRSLDRLLL
jgi:hypothetical protein